MSVAFLDSVFDMVTGQPGWNSLRRACPMLAARLAEDDSVFLNDVPRWHHWAQPEPSWPRERPPGTLRGWTEKGGDYAPALFHSPEFASLTRCVAARDWHCDIRSVDGLLHGGEGGSSRYADLDDFAEACAPALLTDQTLADLQQYLARRAVLEPDGESFSRHDWSRRLYFHNSGGAAQFAAARLMARRRHVRVVLAGRLRTYSLRQDALQALRREFDIYAVSNQPTALHLLHMSMEAARATYYWQRLPRAFPNLQAIFLPRAQARSRKASAILAQGGMLDLGEYLARLAGA